MTLADYLRNEGHEKGIEEGKKLAALRIAKELLKNGLALSLVLNVTGLSEAELDRPETGDGAAKASGSL